MSTQLSCIAMRDLGAFMRQQSAAEARASARERAAESADVIAALERFQDADYTGYCALLDALIKQDTKRAGEILQVAFEVEVNVFAEGEVPHDPPRP
ncbi:hypothetical protein HUS70_07565 [Pandoraea nosoerga]|uniref:hypothetical protein n=1 Tax=Pandoraea nosoerga TaxID=2508296 RepID=UPI0019821A0D|nr:hypothetical protein [Pandoraea nosoerga]MBN4665407.1 hypothetical protein [Pandoraea nosoerga]MBN4674932.1 hypothetical protein [Pandoraea nosoerga]MBN4680248.1 hypothetical protein [Pandoraea nosoerga]MBN4744519.1 hypothetical protein [Pandoraea nosoerga]